MGKRAFYKNGLTFSGVSLRISASAPSPSISMPMASAHVHHDVFPNRSSQTANCRLHYFYRLPSLVLHTELLFPCTGTCSYSALAKNSNIPSRPTAPSSRRAPRSALLPAPFALCCCLLLHVGCLFRTGGFVCAKKHKGHSLAPPRSTAEPQRVRSQPPPL